MTAVDCGALTRSGLLCSALLCTMSPMSLSWSCWSKVSKLFRVSVQGVTSLGGHFACLCRGFEFYEVKKNVIIFQKENGNTFTLLMIFIVKGLQKEQNSTNMYTTMTLNLPE